MLNNKNWPFAYLKMPSLKPSSGKLLRREAKVRGWPVSSRCKSSMSIKRILCWKFADLKNTFSSGTLSASTRYKPWIVHLFVTHRVLNLYDFNFSTSASAYQREKSRSFVCTLDEMSTPVYLKMSYISLRTWDDPCLLSQPVLLLHCGSLILSFECTSSGPHTSMSAMWIW